jgi:hypothetical protein
MIIEPALQKLAHVFFVEGVSEFGSTRLVNHRIEKCDATPIRKAPYRVPIVLKQEMENQVQDLLDNGMIRGSDSPWTSTAIWAPKKSLDGKQKWRICIDFGALKAVTKFHVFPLPRVEDTISCLHGSLFLGGNRLFQRVFPGGN